MLYFQYDPTVDPGVRGSAVLRKSVMILRWAEDPSLRMLIYGKLLDVQTRKTHLPLGKTGYEIHIQVANAWQELSPRDEVFIYDASLLDSGERSKLMQALSVMLVGEASVAPNEVDEALTSILSTYRDR